MALQIFYKQLGVDKVFQIWWWVHLVFILNLYVTANVWIYWDTKKNFSELHQIPAWLVKRNPGVGCDEEGKGGTFFIRRNAKFVTEDISVIDMENMNQDISVIDMEYRNQELTSSSNG